MMKKDESKCLFLLAEKGKWGIKEHIKSLKPSYNGVGWFIESKHRDFVEQISHQAGMQLKEWPLNGETFEELRQRNRETYLNEKSIKLTMLIMDLKEKLQIYELNNEILMKEEKRSLLESNPDGKKLIESIEEYNYLQEQIKQIEEAEKIAAISVNKIPIIPMSERIESHKAMLAKCRGKKHLGLRVKKITEFNDKMLGLRKLILLAAGPNVGKTALTIQLGVEVLLEHPEACLVYVSLEMDKDEIIRRINLYLSGLDHDTYVLGSSQSEGIDGYQNFFTPEELRKINEATKNLTDIGDRLQILDASHHINSETIIEYVERLKAETKSTRVIVVIDYLQCWSLPQDMRFTSDLEADKWRIGEMKKIRDAVNIEHQNPVIVISEARKPSDSDEAWGGDLSDIMGAAKNVYTPDAVLLLNPLQPKQLATLWDKHSFPEFTYDEVDNKKNNKGFPKDNNIKEFLAHKGIALCYLKMEKARDGMKKFNTILAFHFQKNTFKRFDKDIIMGMTLNHNNMN